ncbi:hypothetical protein PIB30_084445, partial [Stylosanthes scabra]|nr:hypothetical protein [Stylosanthes scabra]
MLSKEMKMNQCLNLSLHMSHTTQLMVQNLVTKNRILNINMSTIGNNHLMLSQSLNLSNHLLNTTISNSL